MKIFRRVELRPLDRRLHSLHTLPPTIRQILSTPSSAQSPVTVKGWVKYLRKQKQVAFAEINDGSCAKGLQAVLNPEDVQNLTLGSSVSLTGTIVPSLGKGQTVEMAVNNVEVLGECDQTYPIQKKTHTVEHLREHMHLRPRTAVTASILRFRSKLAKHMHEFFESNDFYHVHTPILTSSDCEGAGEAFRVLSSADLSAPRKQPPTQPQFFTHPSYLTVSSQLHLEALSSSLSRVYTLSPTFRAEKSLTNRHLSEFYMLEAEMSFSDKLEDVMGLVEGCIKYSLKGVIESAKDEIEIFRKRLEDGGLPPDFLSVYSDSFLSDPWPSITYTRAIHELLSHQSANPLAFRFPVEWGLGLQSEHERWLAEELIGGPVFVTDYPASLKPFYMRLNDSLPGTEERGPTVGCFDLLLPRIGELVGGSLREERLSYLERALSEHNLSPKEYEWYLDLRRYGTVKHGGFGLGFERFVSLATGLESVRECTAFPRWGGKTIL